MAGISTTQLVNEVGAAKQIQPKVIGQALYHTGELSGFVKTISAVKGKYPSVYTIMSHVLQRFRPQWDEMGEMEFKAKNLTAYDVKFNVPYIPADVYSGWLSFLYQEGKKPADHTIGQYVMADLAKRITADTNFLLQAGTYTGAFGDFEGTINGLTTQIQTAINSANYPAYLIPLTALTETNAYDQLRAFEKGIPNLLKNQIKRIFTSINNVENYITAKLAITGQNPTYTEANRARTPLRNYELVGLSFFPDNVMFATIDDNIIQMIDIFEQPAITDVQTFDYKVKIFGEGKLGIDFAVNQYLLVANFADADSGFAALSAPAALAMYNKYFG